MTLSRSRRESHTRVRSVINCRIPRGVLGVVRWLRCDDEFIVSAWLFGSVNKSADASGRFIPTHKTRVRRHPERARYDRQTVYDILDQAFVCHVAFISDGMPFVVPTNYVRVGDTLYLHGSVGSRMMKVLATGAPFSLCVTLLDGIVFAPTAAGHSLNYRSVVVLGNAKVVEDADAKVNAMREFVEYVAGGRWPKVRAPNESDMARTMILAVPLVEASAKVRTGFAVDGQEEYRDGTWTGVLPLKLTSGEPIRDPRGDRTVLVPDNIRQYSRSGLRERTASAHPVRLTSSLKEKRE